MSRKGLRGASGQQYEYVEEPPRARALPHGYLRSIACPQCESEAWSPCVNPRGDAIANIHVARRRMALRKWRAEQEAGDD